MLLRFITPCLYFEKPGECLNRMSAPLGSHDMHRLAPTRTLLGQTSTLRDRDTTYLQIASLNCSTPCKTPKIISQKLEIWKARVRNSH